MMSVTMIAAGLAAAPKIDAAAKLSVPKKATVKEGKAVTKDSLNTGNVGATSRDRSGGGITGFGDQRLENCVNLGRTSFGVVGGKVDKDIIDSWNYSAQMFTNVYYSGSIEYGFNWRNNPVEVPGVKSVSDVTDQSASFLDLPLYKTEQMFYNM